MIEAIKKLFGLGPKTNYSQLVKEGAMILDVRTKGEYNSGHIKSSINIPLDQLGSGLAKLKDKNRTIICCCASGMRSGSATSMLKSKGYPNVYNGGSWNGLNNKIHS